MIKIYNDDSPPLEIAEVSTAQNAERIITYLETGKSYNLEMASSNATSPHYDLVSFKDSIPRKLKEIGFSNISNRSSGSALSNRNFRQVWLWPTLIFVLIVLGLFTYRLAKDVAKHP